MSFSIPITHKIDEINLEKGVFIFIHRASKIPPHIGMIINGKLVEISTSGPGYQQKGSDLLKTAQKRGTEVVFIELEVPTLYTTESPIPLRGVGGVITNSNNLYNKNLKSFTSGGKSINHPPYPPSREENIAKKTTTEDTLSVSQRKLGGVLNAEKLEQVMIQLVKHYHSVSNEVSCLNPIKDFIQEIYQIDVSKANFIFELLPILYNHQIVKDCYEVNLTTKLINNSFLFKKYTKKEIEQCIAAVNRKNNSEVNIG